MSGPNSVFRQIIRRCQRSPLFFINNFLKVKHPKAGIIPFKTWTYQKSNIVSFLKNRFVIYKKVRQCGISTVSGAFALWYAMFYPYKTILIVSKRDDDAMNFLDRNIKFPYDNLPPEFRKIWGDPPPTYNEHSIRFPNQSQINSLTSSKETLRSHSASLNILDEVAFIPDMEAMWAAGLPTLSHGGSVICISTPNGSGDWYENTYTDAKEGKNQFCPIDINWWEMDWKITYNDDVSGEERTICPTDGIRKCVTEEDIEKWGPYWSPWLEDQYKMLQQKGLAHKFRQEILAEFIGSGQTVLKRKALIYVQSTVSNKFQTVGIVDYVHPITNEALKLDFENEFHIWRMPIRPQPDVIEHGRVIRKGKPGHIYGVGLDCSTGEDSDLSGIEVIDYTLMEQVAELELRVMPNILIMMADYIGRLYNYALIIPERTGLGAPICQDLYYVFGYANIFRMKMPSGKRSRKIGFPNSPTHKPTLNKAILDNIGEEGVTIYSERLYNQLLKYVHLGRNRTGALHGNHDDLVAGFGCSLLGIQDALLETPTTLISSRDLINIPKLGGPTLNTMLQQGGMGALLPVRLMPSGLPGVLSPEQEIQKFIKQMGGGFVIGGGAPGFGQILVR